MKTTWGSYESSTKYVGGPRWHQSPCRLFRNALWVVNNACRQETKSYFLVLIVLI